MPRGRAGGRLPAASRCFHGGLLVGAALNVDRARAEVGAPVLAATPGFPLLFLSNDGELGPVRAYKARADANAVASDGGAAEVVAPAVWQVDRPGHGVVTCGERR